MKSYRHQLLWKTCFQFVSLVRTEQGIDDGQVRRKKIMYYSDAVPIPVLLFCRTDYQFLMSVWIPLLDSP